MIELGNVIVTLSPAMSVMQDVDKSLGQISDIFTSIMAGSEREAISQIGVY